MYVCMYVCIYVDFCNFFHNLLVTLDVQDKASSVFRVLEKSARPKICKR